MAPHRNTSENIFPPCCWHFRVRRRYTRPARRCGARRGKCWAGTPGNGWCPCRCRSPLGRERRRSRPAGSSGVPGRRPGTPMPPHPGRWSHWWSRSSLCHWQNDEPTNIIRLTFFYIYVCGALILKSWKLSCLFVNRVFPHIKRMARPLKGPGERDRSISGHAVWEWLFPFIALPGLHHCGALPVHILQGAHKHQTINTSYRNKIRVLVLILRWNESPNFYLQHTIMK